VSWRLDLDANPQTGQPRAAAVAASVEAAERRVRDIQAAENPVAEAVRRATVQVRDLRREAAVLRELEREALREMRMAQAWEEVLSPKGVRAHLAEGALAAIEAEANRWLSVLSGGSLSVSFPPIKTTQTGSQREEILTVIRRGDSERELLTFSGGEKKRINLAVDLGVATTFSRSGSLSLSLLVLDEEVFSGMDEEGKAGVITALSQAGVADIAVIDHDARLTGALPRTIEVSLGADGYSLIREVT